MHPHGVPSLKMRSEEEDARPAEERKMERENKRNGSSSSSGAMENAAAEVRGRRNRVGRGGRSG